ncbi:hypothetical protein PG985_001048 [Apiospora marii]|uniref:uncharacterized protein n=1 Tax=Apiospora marii TaxID=335849 RepID=UPI0031319774
MNWKKILINFIDDIPDEKLQGLRLTPGNIWEDDNFRLNMQGLTAAKEHNLQIQINNGISITTLKPYAPNTVSGPVLVPQSYVSTSEIESSAAKSDANQKSGKPAGGKPAAGHKDAKNANSKPSGDAEPATLDPDAIRKAFKETIRPLAEIVGPGQQGKKGQKGQKDQKDQKNQTDQKGQKGQKGKK